MQEFETYLKDKVNSKKTIFNYTQRMVSFYKKYNVFNKETMTLYLERFIDEDKPSIFNLSRSAFRHYIKYKNLDIELPKARIVPEKIKDVLTRDEIEDEIFPYFDMMFGDPELRKLVIRFLMLTMMRISEFRNLKKEHIDFKTRIIKIIKGKGNKNRTTTLNKSIAKELKDYIESHDSEMAFDVSKGYVDYIFYQIKNILKYKKPLTPHSLRHAGAKQYIANNDNLRNLQLVMGHSSLETTQRYLSYSPEELVKAGDKVKYKKRK